MAAWRNALVWAAAAVLFLIANRGAYVGYFSGDDLDNLGWLQHSVAWDFLSGYLSPLFSQQNFRPMGHLFFWVTERVAWLDYRLYVAVIHGLHFVNVALVWMLARRLGASAAAACAGTLFFAFHMALFDAYWKPMYVFDVLCCLFSISCVLVWVSAGDHLAAKRVALCFVLFWSAYKAKEVAVALPAVLAAYEWMLGRKRWKPLVPLFAGALLFGLQGLLLNPNVNNDYTLRFTASGVWKAAEYYASQVFLAPYAGFLLVPLFLLVRDSRARFGLAAMGLWLAPMLFVPGRLGGAYLYLPFAGAALAASALASRAPSWLLAVLCVAWIPWQYAKLRENRNVALAAAHEHRAYMKEAQKVASEWPNARVFLYDGAPRTLNRWGVDGTLKMTYRTAAIQLRSIEDSDLAAVVGENEVVLLSWDPATQTLVAARRDPAAPESSYIAIDRRTPVWQLGTGWYGREHHFRWTRPRATARLWRPADARAFEVVVNASPLWLKEVGRASAIVLLNGEALKPKQVTLPGWQSVRWEELPPGPEGPVHVELQTQPEYRPEGDPRVLGLPVAGLGFR